MNKAKDHSPNKGIMTIAGVNTVLIKNTEKKENQIKQDIARPMCKPFLQLTIAENPSNKLTKNIVPPHSSDSGKSR